PGARFYKRQLYRELLSADLSPDTRVYLSWGERESGRARKGVDLATQSPEAKAELDLMERLAQRNVDSYLYFQPGGEHCEACWKQQNERYLNYLWLDRRG
ncbi:MAG: hypothetical protein Q4B54_14365, partial [Coriobacteriales bacterium]|nr:hypothetical protein [Coriobacteriales bacterium]